MDRKNLKRILVGFLVVCFSIDQGFVFGQETKGPRIKLEDEEIILYDDEGKEIRREYVSQNSEEEQKIFSEIRDKVFKKLNVKDYKELDEKKLYSKYNEEVDKIMKLNNLEQPRLKFIDAKGQIIKEILLGEKRIPKKFKDETTNEEWNGYHFFYKSAAVSKNQKYATISEFSRLVREPPTYASPEPQDAKLTLFDNNGNVLWKKEFSTGAAVGDTVISEEGKVAFRTELYLGKMGPLYIYDKTGKEIFVYPEENEKAWLMDIDKISPNGKYLAVRVGFDSGIVTVFFDLESKKSWKADKDYVVYGISDDGKAKVSSKVGETIFINLKQYLGE